MRMKHAHPRRRPTNVSLDAALVDEARALGLNLSQVFEERLTEVVAAERQRHWLLENKKGFEAYAKYVERHGIFNEREREW